MGEKKRYRNLSEFYPFYCSQHSDRICRRLHFIGTTFALILLVITFFTQIWWLLGIALLQAYLLAWAGHYFFEQNKPATFGHPWLSILSDLIMWWQMLIGRIPF